MNTGKELTIVANILFLELWRLRQENIEFEASLEDKQTKERWARL